MHIEEHDRGRDHFVAVSGRITIDSSPGLRLLLLKRMSTPGRDSLTIDLSQTAYIDTSALAVLLETLRIAHVLGKAFQLTGVRGRPRYLLEATGLIHVFSEIPPATSP